MTQRPEAPNTYRIEQVRRAFALGFSFTPLRGKKAFLDAWQALPRETIEVAVRWARRGNVGVRTGHLITIDGVEWLLVVIDIDPKRGGDATALALPKTPTAITGGPVPGAHFYLLVPAGTAIGNSVDKLGPGIDVRGLGGQVVFPGSIHPDTGKMYRWADGRSPADVPFAVMPDALLQALKRPDPRLRPAPWSSRPSRSTAGRDRAYVEAAMRGEVAKVEAALQGTRNHTLNRAAFALGHFVGARVLDRSDAHEALLDACSAHFQNGFTEEEARRTIKSGLDAGERQPRDMSKLDQPEEGTADDPEGADEQADDRPAFQYLKGEGHRAVAAACAALAKDDSIYQRDRQLVTLTEIPSRPDDADKPPRVVISPIPAAVLWEHLSRLLSWRKYDGRTKDVVATDPPSAVVSAVHQRRVWPGVRPLLGIVAYPVLRYDGTILDAPGYDAATCLFYNPACKVSSIPDAPSPDDAKMAVKELLEVVVDFPFVSDADRSTWLAGLLTPLARPAFDGLSPLYMFTGNIRGAGKGLLCDVIATITTGGDMAKSPFVEDDNEMRKRITAHAVAADDLVSIDNVPEGTALGWPSLDAALTARTWRDRILGKSDVATVPLTSTWYVTGNNLGVRADAPRRVLRARLESKEERPEERQGLLHDPLLPWVRQHRGRLLAAGLTILRAYVAAGRPTCNLKPLGSFESWSALVRSAIVWVGLPDPVETLAANDPQADSAKGSQVLFLEALSAVDPSGDGLLAIEVIEKAESDSTGKGPLRLAILDLCGTRDGKFPSAPRLGAKLRAMKGRRHTLVGGTRAYLDAAQQRTGVSRWRVVIEGVQGMPGMEGMKDQGNPEMADPHGGVGAEEPAPTPRPANSSEPPVAISCIPTIPCSPAGAGGPEWRPQ
jgi:hypothetical protein